MTLIITPSGSIRAIYTEELDFSALGRFIIRRVSRVEPDEGGCWHADLAPAAARSLVPSTITRRRLRPRSRGWKPTDCPPRIPRAKNVPWIGSLRPFLRCVCPYSQPVFPPHAESPMTQHQLDRAVAQATSEALNTVRGLGFSPARDRADLEPEDLGLVVDCPFCGRPCGLDAATGGLPAMAECDPCDLYFEYRADEVYAAEAAHAA